MKNKLIFLSLVVSTALLTTGCGGGGGGGGSNSSSSSNSSYLNITGNVIDPAIEGATVKLSCGAKDFFANQKTDTAGKFNLNEIRSDINFSQCSIISNGGNDGDDLSRLELKSLYKLFNKNSGILVTPFTTILSEHSEIDSDIESAKRKVAEFLGLDNPNDLFKNPEEDLNLAKISKIITKIALTTDADGSLIGILDIDNISDNNLTTYISNELQSKLDTDTYDNLNEYIAAINNANSIDDIKRISIETNVLSMLKHLYSLNDSDLNMALNNLKYLSSKIAEANKKDNKYQTITRNHLRKALYDVELIPDSVGIKDKLIINESIFKNYIASYTISINHIKGFVLYDSNNYTQILGNDNSLRRYYYTYSDKSNIAKAVSLASGNYSDNVNDPVNIQIALGLAKLGFYNEALEQIRDGVYTPDYLLNGYDELSNLYILSITNANKNTLNKIASDALYKRYEVVKAKIQSLGEKNLTNTDQSIVQEIVQKLGKVEDIARATEVSNYLVQIAPNLGTPSAYGRIIQGFEDLSENAYLENNDIATGREFAKKALTFIDSVPAGGEKLAVMYTLRGALNAIFFGETTAAQGAMAKVKQIQPDEADFKLNGGVYAYFGAAIQLFVNNDINQFENTINSIQGNNATQTNTRKRQAFDSGAAAYLVINNQADKLFNDYYTNLSYFSTKHSISNHVTLAPGTIMDPVLAIKMLGTQSQLLDYLNRMTTLIKSWTIDTNSNSQKVYAVWGSELKNRSGALAIASMYKDLNEDGKAQDMIDFVINKVNSFTDMNIKITSLVNILNATSDIGIQTSTHRDIILNNLYSAATMSSYKDIGSIVNVANILSAYGEKSKGKILADKAYGLVESLNSGNLTNIKDKRTKYLVGLYDTKDTYSISVANGYFQAGDVTKSRAIIKEALDGINSLQVTVDQYKLLVNIAIAYGNINDKDSLLPIINRIKTKKEYEESIVQSSTALANYDAFSQSKVATVDSDNDGKPDFFDVLATNDQITASGLTLDDDIDGDGILDDSDILPYDKVK